MFVFVAYATRHGATQGIAERIAETLRDAGVDVTVLPAGRASDLAVDLASYDAFVIGSAAYLGHWQKEAVEFVHANSVLLAKRPVWLFSSGPLGDTVDPQDRDVTAGADPKEIAAFREAIAPRDHRVFFGALDPRALGLKERLIRTMPAGRALLPEGDFRDWREVDSWATGVADALAHVPATAR